MPMPLDGPGALTAEYTAWCARCTNYKTVLANSRGQGFTAVFKAGWHKTVDGLVCPKCVAKSAQPAPGG